MPCTAISHLCHQFDRAMAYFSGFLGPRGTERQVNLVAPITNNAARRTRANPICGRQGGRGTAGAAGVVRLELRPRPSLPGRPNRGLSPTLTLSNGIQPICGVARPLPLSPSCLPLCSAPLPLRAPLSHPPNSLSYSLFGYLLQLRDPHSTCPMIKMCRMVKWTGFYLT